MVKYRSARKCDIKGWLSARQDCREGRFVQLGNSLLLSKKYQQLTPSARNMYLCMAMESAGQREFEFPKLAMKKYGLAGSTGYPLINSLVAAGFIKKVSSGRITREPNQYEFSLEWKKSEG